MLREFVEAIRESVKAERCPVFRTDGQPPGTYFMRNPDGSVSMNDFPPNNRAHTAGDLETIALLVKRFSEDSEVDLVCSVWCSRGGVTAVLNDGIGDSRLDIVAMPLSYHPCLISLMDLSKSRRQWKQKEFIYLLRVSLGTTGTEDLVSAVRNVRFRSASESGGEITRTKASVGRSVSADVTAAAEIPERVNLLVPVFDGTMRDRVFHIACAVEVDPQAETFELTPLPGSVESAICEAEEWLYAAIVNAVEDHANVYRGKP